MRPILALACVAAAAVLAGLVLGEYQLTLLTGVAAGVGVGLVLAEIASAVARARGWVLAAVTAMCGSAAIALAAWIDSGQGIDPIRATAWLSGALAGTVALVRLRPAA